MIEVTPQELGILVVLRKQGALPRKSISVELGYRYTERSYIQTGLKRLCDIGLVARKGETTKTLRYELTGKNFPAVKLKSKRSSGRPQQQKLTVEHLFPQALNGQL